MPDDILRQVWAQARAEREAAVGWEPPDWDAILRRRWRVTVAGLWAILAYWALVDVLRLLIADRPLRPAHLVLAVVWIGLLGARLYTLHTLAGRTEWTAETKQQIRIGHALREHESIGTADRAEVTERAERIDSWALGSFVGWPLLGVLALATIVDGPDLSLPQELGSAAVVVVLVAVLVLRAWRRVRWARRWLADPLPRDEEAPWT